MKPVPEMLRESADTYEQRNKLYGDNYKQFGHLMAAMFPSGLAIRSADDWNRLGILVQVFSKMSRYANQFVAGGHDDSLLDASVYAAMLRELDAMAIANKAAKNPQLNEPHRHAKAFGPDGSAL